MQMALTEVQEFPSIPVKVSLNEYLELAKFFSTKNSSIFVNGILDKAINQLKKENKIKAVPETKEISLDFESWLKKGS